MTTSAPVGRDDEIGRLNRLFTAGSPAGRLLVRGDPGIGKSTLLLAAGARAREAGFLVLTLTGVESEAAFPFGGLHQMLRPVLDRLPALPEASRRALTSAFGLTDGPAAEPFMIALAAVDLLAEVGAKHPVAVIADDVHWLDPQSQVVLAFAARRAAGAVVVGALRNGHPSPLLDVGLPELVVNGLDEEAAARVLDTHAPA